MAYETICTGEKQLAASFRSVGGGVLEGEIRRLEIAGGIVVPDRLADGLTLEEEGLFMMVAAGYGRAADERLRMGKHNPINMRQTIMGKLGVRSFAEAISVSFRDKTLHIERPSPFSPELTLRQRELLDYMSQGFTLGDAASLVGVAEGHARNLKQAALALLQVPDICAMTTLTRLNGTLPLVSPTSPRFEMAEP